MQSDPIIGQRQIALLATVGLLILGSLIGVAFSGDVTGIPPTEAQESTLEGGLLIDNGSISEGILPQENIKEVGRALFSTRYVFALEITALLLTIGVVGAVVLTKRPKSDLEPIPEIETSALIRDPKQESPQMPIINEEDSDRKDNGLEDEDLPNDKLEVSEE